MPKTKQQKQQEAIERKRSFFHVYRKDFMDLSVGGDRYKEILATHGHDFADARAQQASRALDRAAAEAKCDRYGNPL